MAFDNHYPNRKDWRRKYRRAKAIDRSCRPHGSCPFCHLGRLYATRRKVYAAIERIREYYEN